ncbi:uncharacterized protein ARMOST_21582 [Armillaria ostoyae]|uniref:Reverse transcriptase domain-containing protein n=1 Tax=Armillaria ostoyae TaxID=47428 RepID=A0A284SAJ0_ARMOS|nr:uncharacterized protein ARMOST_18149 [Armillaria ostoyae]SJL18011.1 uncharacterized protein ARMOST_21582 [Armillaria ostoyae]
MFYSPRNSSLIKEAWNEFAERLRWRIHFKFTEKNDTEDLYDPDFEVADKRKIENRPAAPKAPLYIEYGLLAGKHFVNSTIAKIPEEDTSSAHWPKSLTPSPARIQKFLDSHDYIVTSTDKNLGIAVSERNWIKSKSLEILANTTDYIELAQIMFNQICDFQCTEMEMIAMFAESNLPNGTQLAKFLRSKITPSGAQHVAPEFYGIPKIHKEPVKFRPIIPCHSAIQNPAAKYVSKMLKPIIKGQPTIIHGSKDLVVKLSQIHIDPSKQWYIVTGDVVAFYPHVNLEAAMQIAKHYYFTHIGEESATDISPLAEIFERCLYAGNKNLVLHYDDKFYRQKRGLAMGVADSPDLANLYGCWFENELNISSRPDIPFYGRYIDDCLAIVYASSVTEAIEKVAIVKYDGCTIEWGASTSHREFLDLMFYKDEQNLLQHRPYRKARSHMERIPWISYHPLDVKRGTFIGELSRMATLCSTLENYREAVQFTIALYIKRGYPSDLVCKWTRDNTQERWDKRIAIAVDRPEAQDVLVLKSVYNTAWNFFSAKELGDTVLGYWRRSIEAAAAPTRENMSARKAMDPSWGSLTRGEVPDELCSPVYTNSGNWVSMPDIRLINILNRRMIVSRKRGRNLFDLTNLWKRTVLARLDKDVTQPDSNITVGDDSDSDDSTWSNDRIDPNFFIQQTLGGDMEY